MRWTVPFLLAMAAAAPLARADEPQIAKVFRQRCASCHTVPDASLRGDRAWRDQIDRTT